MLTEYTTPGESVEVRDDESIYSLLTGRIARTGEDTVIAERKTAPGQWTKVTTGEFHNAVLAAAKGLIAFGINKGDAVTIFSTTRYEWGVLDFALAAIGAVNVPIYDTDSAAQAERIINDSGVKLAELKVDGGMTMNDTLMQFQADQLGVDVVRPVVAETTALGAAYAAGIAVGYWNGEQDVIDNWAEDKRWTPNMDQDERERLYRQWKKAVTRTFDWVDDDVKQ